MRKKYSNFHFFLSSGRLSIVQKYNARRGFTLVELVVVMAIIGVLATLLMVNFVNVSARGRDGTRKSDLQQMRTALELYRSDVGSYPETANFPTCGSPFTNPNDTGVVYMQKVPCDPKNAAPYVYQYTQLTDTTFTLTACIENSQDQDPSVTDDSSVCTSAPNKKLTVINP